MIAERRWKEENLFLFLSKSSRTKERKLFYICSSLDPFYKIEFKLKDRKSMESREQDASILKRIYIIYNM